MHIPEWLIWLQGVVTPLLTVICAAALRVLWGMRQELTTLNVKMELSSQLHDEIDQLWQLVRRLERQVDRLKLSNGDLKKYDEDDA